MSILIVKQQTQDKLNVWRTRKKTEPQMGFEPKTHRDLVGCSNHWATGESMVSKGQFMGLDWNRIARIHSQVMTGTHELTNSITLSHWSISRCSPPTSKVSILMMKQQTHYKLNIWRTRKKSEPQMGFEPTTLRDLVGCSNHWATGDSMVSKGQGSMFHH